MEPLATLDDLLDRISTTLTDAQQARAQALLDDATAAVRAYTGQEITTGTTTLQVLTPINGIVRLPQRPVTAVTTIQDLNANTISFTWYGDDRVALLIDPATPLAWEREPYRSGLLDVRVTYTHGFTTVPADIVAVVCQIAARAYGRAAEEAGLTQESIAGYSYSIGAAAAAGPMGMLADERALLDRYRNPLISAIRIGP